MPIGTYQTFGVFFCKPEFESAHMQSVSRTLLFNPKNTLQGSAQTLKNAGCHVKTKPIIHNDLIL